MKHQDNHYNNTLRFAPIGKRMLIGAFIGLLVILFFLVGVKNPDPTWGKFWMIRPLLIVPISAAIGSVCQGLIIHFSKRLGVPKTIAWVFSVLAFIVTLWLGIVLGLDGTLWD